MEHVDAAVIRQHLIDPEICIRCNTCEATCPVGAITHDARNYVVDAEKCNLCMACIPPCPTGSIDNWRIVPRADAYGVEAQFGWDALPPELSPEELAAAGVSAVDAAAEETRPAERAEPAGEGAFNVADYAAVIPPWSAAHPYANLYGPRAAGEIDHGDCRRQRPGDRSRQGLRHPPHRARFRRDAVSRCSKASRSASSRRGSTRTDGRITRGNIRSRARATASGPATTMCR